MSLQKLYDYAINFIEGTKLFKLVKVYLLSLVERNSLKKWIDEELKKGYIYSFTSLIAALFFFIKKYNRSLWLVIVRNDSRKEVALGDLISTASCAYLYTCPF